jgi:hypothetical protein
MQELDDIALLRQYTEQNSEEAFAVLVSRHVNKRYSVALRHTRNPHQAEEIMQAVFGILRDGEVTSRSQSLIDVEEIPVFEATAKNIRALATDTCQHY